MKKSILFQYEVSYFIHNIEFQGIFEIELLESLLGIDKKYHNALIFNNSINFLKEQFNLQIG